MNNRLILAAAGSGKTTYIVKDAIKKSDEKVLLLTFTLANEKEIIDKFIELNRCVPSNITVQTWFSFLLQHGVRPFQAYLYDDRINGMVLVNKKSGIKFISSRGFPVPWPETAVSNHYFTTTGKIFSDKISKFTVRANKQSDNKVILRISGMYKHIYIDEVQDLAGYDLEIIKLLMQTSSNMCLVGDPRQVTYNTHFPEVFKKYMNGQIQSFLENECRKISYDIDTTSLMTSHRNRSDVCALSSKLYPALYEPKSDNTTSTDHDGIFFIDRSNLSEYLKRYKPVQLRLKVTSTGPDLNYRVYNFGDSKGKTFTRTLIFPTTDMRKWMKDHSIGLKDLTRAQLYVALTRAQQSVGIYLDGEDISDYSFLNVWKP